MKSNNNILGNPFVKGSLALLAVLLVITIFKNKDHNNLTKAQREERFGYLKVKTDDTNEISTYMKNYDSSPQKKLADLIIEKEEKVLDAYVSEVNVFYAYVADDNSKQDGYAQYLGHLLAKHGSDCKHIKVMAINSLDDPKRDSAYGRKLGEYMTN